MNKKIKLSLEKVNRVRVFTNKRTEQDGGIGSVTYMTSTLE